MMTWACLLLITAAQLEPLAVPVTDAAPPATISRVFGRTPAAVMAGNGRLTVSLDASGSVVSLRWPSPGYFEHGWTPVNEDSRRTLSFGIHDGETLHWAREGEQRYRTPSSVVIENAWEAGAYRVRQETFVHPALDTLLVRLHVDGDARPEAVIVSWRPAPTSRVTPQLPIPARSAGGTLTLHEAGRVYAVKPHDHSASTRALLDSAVTGHAGTQGLSIEGPAIWLGLETHPGPSHIHLALRREPLPGAMPTTTGRHALTGPADAWLSVRPEAVDGGGWEAWVLLSAADSLHTLEESMRETSLRRAYLLDGVDRFWDTRMLGVHLPGPAESPEATLARRALMTILMLQDRTSGAIARAPVSMPPLALDRPADSIWAGHALAAAGLTAEAQRHFRFLASAMRDGRRRSHDGAFAEAYYADGAEAMPPAVLDADHSAWFIWAVHAASELLPPEQASGFRESMWGPVQRAADFIHGWWDPSRRRPLASFDPIALRDRARPEQLLTAYGALDNALAIAAHAGTRHDHWVSRRAELRALIDYHLVDESGDWRLTDPSPFWPMGAFPLGAAIWNRALEMPVVEGMPAHEAARLIHFQIRAANERQPIAQEGLTDFLEEIAAESIYAAAPSPGAVFWPDSLTAAHIFLALMQAGQIAEAATAP